MIKIGDKVIWTSQAGSYSKTKKGTVIGFACPNEDALKYIPLHSVHVASRIKGQRYSLINRAVVEVPRENSQLGICDYYFPRITALSSMGGDEQ